MAKCLVYETLNSVNEMTVKTSKDGLMTLSGVFGVCGVKNNNNRVYEKANYGKCVSILAEQIARDGGVPGELEHPQSMNITLENISHKITDIKIDENGVVTGTIQLLDTPKGQIAQKIVEGGLPLFVSSRAMGQVDKSGNVVLEHLATYDLVGSPGFSQARMHLNESQCFESITDNMCIISEKESNIEDMNNEEILEKLSALEARINDLESENQDLREQVENAPDFDLKALSEGIQKWIMEQYSPEIEKWIMNSAATQIRKDVMEHVAAGVQKWVMEQYSPEVEKWVLGQVAPEVEKWITENYSPEVEKWVLDQVAPGIQSWTVEHFAPSVQEWIDENYSETVQNIISESQIANKSDKLKSITDVLTVLEGIEIGKPAFNGRQINEQNVQEPKYIAEMPANMRPLYEMATPEQKDYIVRKANLYDFSREGAVQRFWESVNFENIKPTKSLYEGLENIADQRERAIRAQLRSFRNR